MNQHSSKSRLEARLRDHYCRMADDLTLDKVSWDDVLAGRGRRASASGRRDRGRWVAAASVVTLIAGATAGAVAMFSGDGGTSQVASAPTAAPSGESEVSTSLPATSTLQSMTSLVSEGTDDPAVEEGTEVAQPSSTVFIAEPPVGSDRPFMPCPDDPALPPDAASTVYPNDVRFNGMPLPEATPDGYCVIDHNAGAGPDGNSNYTAWATCTDCAQPTAAIALIRDPVFVAEDPSQEPGAIQVPLQEGRGGWFVPPSATSAISALYTTDAGGATVVFAGWGLDQDAFVAFAEAATTAGAALPGGLEQVYDGGMSGYFVGLIPTGHNFHVGYASATGTESLSYAVFYDGMTWPAETRLPLMALAWVAPNPVLAETGDEQSIAFGPAPAHYGGQQTILVTTTPNSVTTWVSTGVAPMSLDELAEMPLTAASS